MASQDEAIAKLNAIEANLEKVGGETSALVAEVAALKEQIANLPNSDAKQELMDAIDRVGARVKTIDDFVADPEVEPTPPAEG